MILTIFRPEQAARIARPESSQALLLPTALRNFCGLTPRPTIYAPTGQEGAEEVLLDPGPDSAGAGAALEVALDGRPPAAVAAWWRPQRWRLSATCFPIHAVAGPWV